MKILGINVVTLYDTCTNMSFMIYACIIQNPQLVKLPIFYLKDEIEPAQVLLAPINLSYDVIQIAKHTIMGTLWLYVDYQEPQNFEICHLNVEKSDTALPCTLPSANSNVLQWKQIHTEKSI